MENRLIKKKYEYWEENGQYFLALDDVNVDLSRKNNKQYFYTEYVDKIVVFTTIKDLIDFLIYQIKQLECIYKKVGE